MSLTYGIIGNPLDHSFSPKYFKEKFERENIDGSYNLYPLRRIEELPMMLEQHPKLIGLNITSPFKTKIIPYLTLMHSSAEISGAVNCIAIRSGQLIGFNTDIVGFRESIKPHHKRCLILGTGGASTAVAYVLELLGIDYTFVSRKTNNNTLKYSDLTYRFIKDYQIIINTTPLGLFPNVQTCPDIPYSHLNHQYLLYDLIYNPQETLFLKNGKVYGAAIKNGFEMLQIQAEAAWVIWNNVTGN